MTQLIPFEIYRKEVLILNGQEYTVSFSRRFDGEEHQIFAVNFEGNRSIRGSFSTEMADDFTHYTGNDLQKAVYNILKDELDRP